MHKKIGVNSPCPCGSGKKYKRCCRRRESQEGQLVPAVTQEPAQSEQELLLGAGGRLQKLGQHVQQLTQEMERQLPPALRGRIPELSRAERAILDTEISRMLRSEVVPHQEALLAPRREQGTAEHLRYQCWQEASAQRFAQALLLSEQYLALCPDDTEMSLQRLRFLELLERSDELRREAAVLLKHQQKRVRRSAQVILAIHHYSQQEYEEARACFEKLPAELSEDVFLGDPGFTYRYLLCRAEMLYRSERREEAMSYFLRATEVLPSPGPYQVILLYFCEKRDFEAVARYLPAAEVLDPDNFYFLVARLYLTADQEQWQECERLLRPYQQDDFAKHGLLPRWVDLKMRVLAHTESSVAAFAFAEEHLDVILQDEAMTAFRRGLWDSLLAMNFHV